MESWRFMRFSMIQNKKARGIGTEVRLRKSLQQDKLGILDGMLDTKRLP